MRAPIVLALFAFVVRLFPMFLAGGPFVILEYDDGVHLAAALQAMDGRVPYRDFVFVQPPGALYLFTPLAALSGVIGEPSVMILARMVTAAVGATTAILVAKIVGERHRRAGLLAGAFYAVWQPAVLAERTALLEPYIALGVLLSVLLLGSRTRSLIASAAVAAVAAVVKIWVLPLLPILAIVVWRRYGLRSAVVWCVTWCIAAATLIAPFAVLAGAQMREQVLDAQASRPADGPDLWVRMHDLSGFGELAAVERVVSIRGLAVIGIVMVAVAAASALFDPAARIWAVLGTFALLVILTAASFSYHYAGFVAPFITIGVGYMLARHLHRRPHQERAVSALVLLTLPVLLAGSLMAFRGQQVPPDVRAVADRGACVWASTAALAVALDRAADNCTRVIDYFGTALVEDYRMPTGAVEVGGDLSRKLRAVQDSIRRDLVAVDVVVLREGLPQSWDARTTALFDERFELATRGGAFAAYTSKL